MFRNEKITENSAVESISNDQQSSIELAHLLQQEIEQSTNDTSFINQTIQNTNERVPFEAFTTAVQEKILITPSQTIQQEDVPDEIR